MLTDLQQDLRRDFGEGGGLRRTGWFIVGFVGRHVGLLSQKAICRMMVSMGTLTRHY